jgi:hypothetical protein
LRRLIPQRPRTRRLLAAMAIVFLALALRIHGLGRESLFHDEIAQIGTYGGSLQEILLRAARHPQPPLDYWLGSLVGHPESDALVRLPAALFGAGSVAFLILYGARFLPGPAALLPGLLLALMPFSLYYSQHARPYSIAIFFTLFYLWTLDVALRRKRASWPSLLLLFFGATGFLWSRVFDPMMLIAAVMLVLALRTAADARREGAWRSDRQRLRLAALLVQTAALLAFLPLFRILLAGGRRWAGTGGNDPLSLIAKGISSFSPLPLFKSYLVQLDPLGFPLLPLVAGAVLLSLVSREWREDPLLSLVPPAFPVAAVLATLAFGSTSDFSLWRPAYAAWMLPLGTVSAAAALLFLWRRARARGPRPAAAVAVFIALLLGLGAWSAAAFKSSLKNEDWRGVCAHLRAATGPGQVIVFAGVVPSWGWEPTFYGFPRYYRGRTPLLSLDDVPELASRMAGQAIEPVFLVYHYRNYYLTPLSLYAPITTPRGEPDVGTGRLGDDSALDARLFNSFTVVRLRERKGDLAADAYRGLERILDDLPPGPHLGRIHLAAAFLGRSLGDPGWKEHRDRAREELGDDGRFRARLDLLRSR